MTMVIGEVINQEFEIQVLKTYGWENTTRKVSEAMRIYEDKGVNLHSKADYGQPKVPRVVIESSTNNC